MEFSSKYNEKMDSGCLALVMIARFHQVAADPTSLRHQFCQSDSIFTDLEIIHAAKYLKLKAKSLSCSVSSLERVPLPAMAKDKAGNYFVLGQFDSKSNKVLFQSADGSRPKTCTLEQFSMLWTGELILVSKRSLMPGMTGKFDISWFIPSLIKHKKLLSEVLLASFFIQLFALVTPLFFQVIIDKVLVHRGLTTLDVLAFGLIVISLFDVLLNGLRSYLFSHTASRIDVTLGSNLFRHLVNLPISYFESRQVGTTVARVRELETIRNFITGSALTLVIDILFTFVFLPSYTTTVRLYAGLCYALFPSMSYCQHS